MQHDTVPTAQVQFHHKLAHTITAYNIQDCHRHLSITMGVAQVYPFCNPTANCPSSEVYVCNCDTAQTTRVMYTTGQGWWVLSTSHVVLNKEVLTEQTTIHTNKAFGATIDTTLLYGHYCYTPCY